MIRFIWQNWWRRKERLILLIIGAFTISAGLTYLIGLSETNKGTIVDTLQQRWSASYDIVVRPAGTQSITEDKKLLEPNYLSGLNGGISMEQYETIKGIAGVEVAAPIAMIGYADYQVTFGNVVLPDDGIYRRINATTVDNGLSEETSTYRNYFPQNIWDINDKGPEYGVGAPHLDLTVYSYSLLAGIDPEQEAKLVGLDEAIMDLGKSRYFENGDVHAFNEQGNYHEFPIIVNQKAFVDKVESITFERLDLQINHDNADEVMEMVKEKGGAKYLDTLEGDAVQTFSYTGEETFHSFVSKMTGVDWKSGQLDTEMVHQANNDLTSIVFRPTPLEFREIESPYADRWPFSYQIAPFMNGENTVGVYKNRESFREPKVMAPSFLELPKIKPNWIGFYDTGNLAISMDPTNELPMETYRPATAEFVMDAKGNPVNPPAQLQPTGDPYSFLSDPPGMLTTIEAAENLLGDKPISSIRIKVSGVSGLSDDSQAILDRVAAEIEERTGLMTDITLGSSPQLALTYIPGLNGEDDLGWIQQPWVNIGSSISIFRETKVGFSAVLSSVIAVAIVYVWSSGIVSLLARRKEFAVLLSVGWRTSQLSRLLFLESTIIGLFVALISWMMLGFIYVNTDSTISFTRFFWTGTFGLIVYILGAVVPVILTRNISPYEAMRTGEISSNSIRLFHARGIYRMAFNHFIGKWKRSILSVISIALPTALLAMFLYISLRLRGIMYTSLLGEYVALEIGPAHYAAIFISLLIAILTTAEIMWQNVSERREEISLLQAIGWKRWGIRRLILAEGIFSGLFAGIIGLSLAILMMFALYGEVGTEDIGFILATGLVPVTIGLIGSIFPAERAVRMVPSQGMSGSVTNRKNVEKRLKWTLLTASALVVGIFLFMMIKVAPKMEVKDVNAEIKQPFNPTTGEVVKNEPESSKEDDNQEAPPKIDGSGAYETPGGYELEFPSHQTSLDTSWRNILSYSAKEIDSQLPAEPGMKNLAIELSFEILENTLYEMKLDKSFSLLIGEETYRPVDTTVLEAEGWDEEYLNGYLGGKMHAILEFSIPEDTENYGLLFKNRSIGKGILIRFDQP